jgi:hypothetical protein
MRWRPTRQPGTRNACIHLRPFEPTTGGKRSTCSPVDALGPWLNAYRLRGHPETRTFGEVLIDLEEDKAARAVVFGLLAEMEQR